MSKSDEIIIAIKGESAQEIKKIQELTGKHPNEVDVVIAALRIYNWTLAQQAAGGIVVAEFPKGSRYEDTELTDYLLDKKAAAGHYRKYGTWPSKKAKSKNKKQFK